MKFRGTRAEALALWERQYDRMRLVKLSETLGVRAREWALKAQRLEARAAEWRQAASDEAAKAGERCAEALAIEQLSLEDMGKLYTYADGRAESVE